ncbi:GcrA family cell cycle regulator [Pararhizobium mangrovi]|uniref:GcrA cell cycle regulator n=1 Tax=Pararhizobium mangrovi TaxID=2590452 RepID=A0A506U047_9HYPH|nr:GcrA family cell cycle regulator [Pararhizobium mangrovi]TPW25959.1 GcrA cell cycle regulator [Pararhizobium mangrovi]
MSWTEERIEKLKKLWADGLSASQIATQLGGVSRNAVIGKVHRLSLPGRAKSSSATAPARPKRTTSAPKAPNYASRAGQRSMPRTAGATALKQEVAFEATPVADARPVDDVVVPMARHLELIELTEHTCKWPVGDPLQDDFHFCGNDAGDSGPYCRYHAKLAFQPSSERRRAAKA